MPPVLTVRFYASRTGNEPAREWLRSLPLKARKAIGMDIKTIQFGWPLGMPLVRKMEAGLWEVRSDIPDGIARLLFTTVGLNDGAVARLREEGGQDLRFPHIFS